MTARALATAALSGLLCGCATRTIHIPAGEPVKLAAPVPNHPVWIIDQHGQPTRTRLTIPEGWWAIQDTGH